MAHKKGVGSSRNGRDSNPKYQGIKKFGPVLDCEFVSQPHQGAVHHLLRPAFLIRTIGVGLAGRLGKGATRIVQRQDLTISAAFLAAGPLPFVRQIIFQRAQQKRSELTALCFRPAGRMMLEQVEEKPLGQILCFLGAIA